MRTERERVNINTIQANFRITFETLNILIIYFKAFITNMHDILIAL